MDIGKFFNIQGEEFFVYLHLIPGGVGKAQIHRGHIHHIYLINFQFPRFFINLIKSPGMVSVGMGDKPCVHMVSQGF